METFLTSFLVVIALFLLGISARQIYLDGIGDGDIGFILSSWTCNAVAGIMIALAFKLDMTVLEVKATLTFAPIVLWGLMVGVRELIKKLKTRGKEIKLN